MARDIRDKVVKLLRKKKLSHWTVAHVAETGLSKTQLSNCFHHMKNAGLIVDSGKQDGNMKIWTWPTAPPDFELVPEGEESEGVTYHDVGMAVSMLLRKQDAQIAHDTDTIKNLTQRVADLQVKNTELAEKLNRVTEGRLSAKEIGEMARRSSLQ